MEKVGRLLKVLLGVLRERGTRLIGGFNKTKEKVGKEGRIYFNR